MSATQQSPVSPVLYGDESPQACPACRSSDLQVYLGSAEPAFDLTTVGSSRTVFSHGRILRCSSCRHGFRNNQPSYTELAATYRLMNVAVYESENDSRLRTAAKHFSLLRRYARGTGHLLDVGCASGLFLEQAVRAGWRIRGVEPNEELAKKAAERLGPATVVNRTLEEAELPSQSFDAITLWDVLEHVADPAGVLSICGSLLRPDGVLIAKVPDLDSSMARLMREKWPLLLPEHLSYFTKKSLRALSARANLRPVKFFRSTVAFSVGYVLLRLSQHRIPSAAVWHRLVKDHALGKVSLSLPLGELYVVFTPLATQ